jgi:hypothetical protein
MGGPLTLFPFRRKFTSTWSAISMNAFEAPIAPNNTNTPIHKDFLMLKSSLEALEIKREFRAVSST